MANIALWLVVEFGRIEADRIIIEVPETLDAEKCFDKIMFTLGKVTEDKQA